MDGKYVILRRTSDNEGKIASCCRHAKEWEGELVCRLNLWRKRQSIYTGAECLAGMLAEQETRL
jgi:hypothetical protein